MGKTSKVDEKKLELWLTEGMLGTKSKKICTSKDHNKVLEALHDWKSDKKNTKRFKVEPYDRIMHYKDKNAVVIDFGDWHWFMQIDNVDESTFEKMIAPR